MATNKPNEDKKPDGVVNPQVAASDTPKVVDHSAPADNNIESIKTDGASDGKDRTDPNIADVQAGDPRVKVKRADGTVEERDATKGEAKAVADGDEKPAIGNPPAQDGDAQATPTSDGVDVEKAEQLRVEAEEAKSADTVELKNPSGRTVTVRIADVIKRRLFDAGFDVVEGESYPDEVQAEKDAFDAKGGAQAAYTGSDQGDNGQDKTNGDDESRRGKATLESRQKELAKGKVQPVSTAREDGQVFDPKTQKPQDGSRLANALNKG